MLAEGLLSPNPSFAGACAEALGRIGAPEAIPALVEALLDLRPNVRAAAAHALGSIGSSVAAASLLDVVDEEEPQVSRQAAQALLELGPGGRRDARDQHLAVRRGGAGARGASAGAGDDPG